MPTYNPRRSPVKRKPTSTAELWIDLAHLSNDPKYSNALPLRLRATCVPHALHPTDKFDAHSVRKDTQPESTRVQPPQGVPTFQPREYLASSPRCVCALELGSKVGRSKSGSRARGPKSMQTTQKSDKRKRSCDSTPDHESDFTQDRYSDSRDKG